MSDRDRPKPTPPAAPTATPPAAKPGGSGRVQFDDRGQAVWEWSVKTGMFDRNADTQRIKKLLDEPSGLEIVDYDAIAKRDDGAPAPGAGRVATARAGAKPAAGSAPAVAPGKPGAVPDKAAALPDRAGGFNPYERVEREAPAPTRRDSAGGDPYSSGPAKKPENVSFNPYERTPGRKK